MSLDPALHNLKVWKGTNFHKRLTWYTDSTLQTQQPLVGYSAVLEVRSHLGDPTPIYTLNSASGGIVLAAAGNIDIFIPASDNSTFTWNTGYYHLYMTDASGNTDMLLYGGIVIISV